MSHPCRIRSIAGIPLVVVSVLIAAYLPSTAVTQAARTDPAVTLRASYDSGEGRRLTARLTCRGSDARASGYLRRRAPAACRQARRIARFLASTPPSGRICDQIYGGPATARLHGKIGARTVDRRFSRRDGCGIADWTRAGNLLPRTTFRP